MKTTNSALLIPFLLVMAATLLCKRNGRSFFHQFETTGQPLRFLAFANICNHAVDKAAIKEALAFACGLDRINYVVNVENPTITRIAPAPVRDSEEHCERVSVEGVSRKKLGSFAKMYRVLLQSSSWWWNDEEAQICVHSLALVIVFQVTALCAASARQGPAFVSVMSSMDISRQRDQGTWEKTEVLKRLRGRELTKVRSGETVKVKLIAGNETIIAYWHLTVAKLFTGANRSQICTNYGNIQVSGGSNLRVYGDFFCSFGDVLRKIVVKTRWFSICVRMLKSSSVFSNVLKWVPISDVEGMASSLRCSHDSLPFIYLGLPFCDGCSVVIDRFRDKLSCWKAKTLSIGGRVTLIKSILGSLPGSVVYCPKTLVSWINGSGGTEEKVLWNIVIKEFYGAGDGFNLPANGLEMGFVSWSLSLDFLLSRLARIATYASGLVLGVSVFPLDIVILWKAPRCGIRRDSIPKIEDRHFAGHSNIIKDLDCFPAFAKAS
ncbi:hypothetical protein Tco_1073919 [Tanacetum coccineum]